MLHLSLVLAYVLRVPRDAGPHVVALPLQQARSELRRMADAADGDGRRHQSASLRTSLRMYDVRPPHSLKCIAVAYDGSVHAVALLERLERNIHVWNIECDDESSGTILVAALHHVPQRIVFEHTLHPRWALASACFAEWEE